jgi:hypothetical protein
MISWYSYRNKYLTQRSAVYVLVLLKDEIKYQKQEVTNFYFFHNVHVCKSVEHIFNSINSSCNNFPFVVVLIVIHLNSKKVPFVKGNQCWIPKSPSSSKLLGTKLWYEKTLTVNILQRAFIALYYDSLHTATIMEYSSPKFIISQTII